jgi:hypothetical protein
VTARRAFFEDTHERTKTAGSIAEHTGRIRSGNYRQWRWSEVRPPWTFAAEGQRGALVARKYTGGSCPNIACRPSKNIIHSASVASFVCSSKEFGIATGPVSVDMSRVRHSKRRMVADLVDLDIPEYRKSGAEVILGFARFIVARTVEATLPDGTTRRPVARTWSLVREHMPHLIRRLIWPQFIR